MPDEQKNNDRTWMWIVGAILTVTMTTTGVFVGRETLGDEIHAIDTRTTILEEQRIADRENAVEMKEKIDDVYTIVVRLDGKD